jgi:hypothetical protein
MKILFEFINRLSVKEPAVHDNLAVFPVFGDGAPALTYLLLEEALTAGGFKVGEVGGGRVLELQVTNATGKRVLLLDGEELIGAKQNRIFNTSILVEAGSEIRIPVSCVEQHRWDRGAGSMYSGVVAYPELRRQKAHQVYASLKATGLHHSDQLAMWESLAGRMEELKDCPATSRMEALYEVDRLSLEEFLRRLACPTGACGVVAVIDGRIVCADVFDSPSTLERLWASLVTSYALDAQASSREVPAARTATPIPTSDQVSRFLSLPPDTSVETFASPGIGQSLRFRTPDRVGSALVFEEVVVHLEVFPSDGQSRQAFAYTRMAGPSRRGPRI